MYSFFYCIVQNLSCLSFIIKLGNWGVIFLSYSFLITFFTLSLYVYRLSLALDCLRRETKAIFQNPFVDLIKEIKIIFKGWWRFKILRSIQEGGGSLFIPLPAIQVFDNLYLLDFLFLCLSFSLIVLNPSSVHNFLPLSPFPPLFPFLEALIKFSLGMGVGWLLGTLMSLKSFKFWPDCSSEKGSEGVQKYTSVFIATTQVSS